MLGAGQVRLSPCVQNLRQHQGSSQDEGELAALFLKVAAEFYDEPNTKILHKDQISFDYHYTGMQAFE